MSLPPQQPPPLLVNLPPPPPVMGVGLLPPPPPPPLPNNVLPPPPLPVPPLVGVAPPPHPSLQQPIPMGMGVPAQHPYHPHHRSVPLQPPTVVVLIGVPPFLHHARSLRDWIASCGNARSVQLVPAITVAHDNKNSNKDGSVEQVIGSTGSTTGSHKIALLTMSHSDAAVRLVTAFRAFKTAILGSRKLEQEEQQEKEKENEQESDDKENDGKDDNKENDDDFASFQAHLVPTNPDVPLPPFVLDPKLVQSLADQLVASFEAWKRGDKKQLQQQQQQQQQDVEAPSELSTTNDTTTTTTSSSSIKANNANDDDEGDLALMDPLQSAQVRQAVQDFRHKIETLQGSKSSRRQELVALKVEQLLPMVRLRLEQEKKEAAEQQQQLQQQQQVQQQVPPPGHPPQPSPASGGFAPPPPFPLHLLPPPPHLPTGGLPPPPPFPMDNNLPLPPPLPVPPSVPPPPVSMEQQQQQSQEEEPPLKRARVAGDEDDVGGIGGTAISGEAADHEETTTTTTTALLLRDFVTSQIRHYLGEEEPTLTSFIVQKVTSLLKKNMNTTDDKKMVLEQEIQLALSAELRDLLEEDAPAFLQALADKVQELLMSQS